MAERKEGVSRPHIFPMSSIVIDRVLSRDLGAFIDHISFQQLEGMLKAEKFIDLFAPFREILAGGSNEVLFSYLANRVESQLMAAVRFGLIETFPQVASNYMMGVCVGAQLVREAVDSTQAKMPEVREGDINAYLRERPSLPDFHRIGVMPSAEVTRQVVERSSEHLFTAEPALGIVKDFFVRMFPEDSADGFPYIQYSPFELGLQDIYFPVRKAHDRMRSKGK